MSEPSFPHSIAIDPDDFHASGVGHAADGRQVLITRPFVPARGADAGREFLAIYLFDTAGALSEARITDLGPRSELDPIRARQVVEQLTAEVGALNRRRIEIRPFELERFGVTFGLVPRPPDEPKPAAHDFDDWWVEAQPGNYLAFHAPWDSGEYDT